MAFVCYETGLEKQKARPSGLAVVFPPLRLHRELDAFGRDEDGAGVGLGEVADDVEGLEIPAELLRVQDRDREEEPQAESRNLPFRPVEWKQLIDSQAILSRLVSTVYA